MFRPVLCTAVAAILLHPVAASANPPAATPQQKRQQLEDARREIVAMRLRLQKRTDDLPEAAEALKRTDDALKAQQEQIEKELGELLPQQSPPSPQPLPAGTAPDAALSLFGRIINLSVDTRMGFDREDLFLGAAGTGSRGVLRPEAVKATARRLVNSTTVTANSPLRPDTTLVVSAPYVYQSVRLSAPGQSTRTLTGQGIGDTTIAVERRFGTGASRGTNLSVTAGLQLPTGRSPFGLSENQLPTGEGFYQPLIRVGVQTLRVPLQFFASADYQSAFPRRFEGRTVRLSDSYGGQIGFSYATGPEIFAQTAISLRRVSGSPLRFSPRTTEGYLSQSLTWRSGGRNIFQGWADVGLTEDSLDLWLGLTFRRSL